jgi:exodeoxyribonuclease VII large subunit
MPITLSQLNTSIRDVIDNNFRSQTYDLIAEIGQVTIKQESRVAYLDLVEKGSKPAKFIARSQAQIWSKSFDEISTFEKITGQKLTNGITILMKVNVGFHVVYGLKINILSIDAQYTLGALAQAKENTILQLLGKYPNHIQRKDGKITSYNQGLALPKVIQRIALITGNQAEGGIDFIHELIKNQFGYQFEIVPFIAIMQGDKSPDSIREQLIKIYQSSIPFDVVVLVRGGGAQLDLHAFDQYPLIEAMIRFPIPIFTGIGHTRNVSLADEVAFAAYKNPTKVAEVIVQNQKRFEDALLTRFDQILQMSNERLLGHHQSLRNTLYDISIDAKAKLSQHQRFLNEYLLRYENTAARVIQAKERKVLHLALPLKVISSQKITAENLRLNNVIAQFSKWVPQSLQKRKEQLQTHSRFIDSQHPKKWMKKGFALIYQHNQVITHAASLDENTGLQIMMQDGSIDVEITKKQIHGK